jgi:hypothetical protein
MLKTGLSRKSRKSRKYNQKGGAEFIPHHTDESKEQRAIIKATNQAIDKINKELEQTKDTMMGKILKMTVDLEKYPALDNITNFNNDEIKNHFYHVAAYYLKKPLNELQCISDKFVLSDSLIQDKHEICRDCPENKTYVTYDTDKGDLKFLCEDDSKWLSVLDKATAATHSVLSHMPLPAKDTLQQYDISSAIRRTITGSKKIKTEIHTTSNKKTKYGYYACKITGPIEGYLQGFFLHSTDRDLINEIAPEEESITKCAGIFYTKNELISGIFNLSTLTNLNTINLTNGMGHVMQIKDKQINKDETYTGEWTIEKSSVKYTGYGTLRTKHSTYIGSWKDGEKSGYGSFFDREKEYVGQWKDDQYDGNGTLQYFWKNDKHNNNVQNFIKYNVGHWNYETKTYNNPNDRYKALKMLPIERIVGDWKLNKPVNIAVIKYFNNEDYIDKGVLSEYNVFYPGPGEYTTLKKILPDNYYYSKEFESILPELESVEGVLRNTIETLKVKIDEHVPPQVITSESTVGARGFALFLFGIFCAPIAAAAATVAAVATAVAATVASPLVLVGAIEAVKWVADGAEKRSVVLPENDTVKLGYLEKKDQTTEQLRLLHSAIKFIGSRHTETIPTAGGYNKFSKINKKRRRNISKINKKGRRNISKRIYR